MPRRNRSGAHYRRKRHEARTRAREAAIEEEVTTDRLARELVETGRASTAILGPRSPAHHRRGQRGHAPTETPQERTPKHG